MASRRPAAEALLRLVAAALTAWLFLGATLSLPPAAGVSTFGRPPELSLAWIGAGLAGAWWLLRAGTREVLARRLLLVLVTATLLGHRGVPGDGGVRLLLLGVTLVAARPLPPPGRAALTAAAALLLAVPAMLGTDFPQGSLLWLSYVLPPAAMALLVPALFPGRDAERVVWTLLAGTAVLCVGALGSYVSLAHGLELPLRAVLATRLRLLGLHPNLAVPHLVTTLVLGLALVPGATGRRRWLALLLLAPVFLGLCAVRSRTGWLALGFGGGLFAVGALPALLPAWRPAAALAHWTPRLAGVAVAALLLWPALGGADGLSLQGGQSMVGKAVSFRASMWALGRDTFAAAPWHGFGPGTSYVQARYAQPGAHEGLPKDDHPHNVVLAVGEALGWPGLLGLALLFGLGLRRLRAPTLLAVAAGSALLALWAANAIDLGGADATLYPALVFLLLALREADEPGAAAGSTRAAGTGAGAVRAAERSGVAASRVALALAAICLLSGLSLGLGDACERRALVAIEGVETQRRAGTSDAAVERDAANAERWLSRALALQPWDPNLPLLRARLESARRRPGRTLAALVAARELFPGSATLAHQAALVLSAQAPDDPRVDLWLAEAVAADPYGPDSWRRHLDRAALAARRGRHEEARAELLATVLLNPGALRTLPRSGTGDALVVHPGGEGTPGVPVAELLSGITRLREDGSQAGPDEAARLRLRVVEVLLAVGQHEAAEAAARTLLADNPLYLEQRTAQSCLSQGRVDEAIERLRRTAPLRIFGNEVLLLDALSQAVPLDRAAFDAQLAAVLDHMAQEIDVVFEIDTVRQLLDARLRCAERGADLSLAARLSDALAFARR